MNVPGASPEHYAKHHGDDVLRDWPRVQRFAEIVGRLEGVRTAAPLRMDPQTGTIEYERLAALQPLLSLHGASLLTTLDAVGRLLARFHVVSQPAADEPASPCHPLDVYGLDAGDVDVLTRALPAGFFWGDCWHGNVLLGSGLVFLDPLPNRWLFEGSFARANGALDIATLYMSLHLCHPLHRLLRIDATLMHAPAQALLTAYLDELGAASAAPAVLRLSRQLAERYVDTCRYRLARPIAAARQLASRRILANLERTTGWNRP